MEDNASGGARSGGGLRNTESKPGTRDDPRKMRQNWRGGGGVARQWRERKPPPLSREQESDQRETHQFLSSEFSRLNMTVTSTGMDSPRLPQLAQVLREKLRKGEMECMICYDMIGRNARVWSCSGCYSIFHLMCVKKWARAPTSIDRDGNWRCPGCQMIQLSPARELHYSCFCGQQVDPPVDFYLTPHSCGQTCKKPLDKSKTGQCQHFCTLQCHPGPCPPCTAFNPPEACGCGRKTVTRRCIEANRSSISCGYQCGRLLSCGRHHCSRICHCDECGECREVIPVACFCLRKLNRVACSQVHPGELANEGVFSCGLICGKLLDCGNHSCSSHCHPGDCGDCERSPQKVVTCPCKKTALLKPRESCLDSIPTCGQLCEKLMSCGKHNCRSLCHLGPCPPCEEHTEQKCRCGSSSRVVLCLVASSSDPDDEHAFICDKKCEKKRNCGRHRCNNRCCPSDQEGERHFCMLECGKKLRCGEHFCQELCHPGHCRPCLQSSFTDLTCACGKSSIPPPVPCGTLPPPCDFLCVVPQPCGHAATHSCHFGECPPCAVLVSKECVGQHVVMRNVPCGSKTIKCNRLCGKLRKCGLHPCGRVCHSESCDSDDTGLSCGQVCGASRRECLHSCIATCHPGSPCPDVRCNFMVTITCSCERLTASVPCEIGGPAARDKVPASQRKLACDDDCVKSQRLKSLADALGIETNGDPLTAYGSSDCVQEMAKKDSQFLTAVEDRFKYLLLGPKAVACGSGLRVHVFTPLPRDKRAVVHQLAHKWNLSSSSVGWEPRRYMVVHVNSKSKMPGHSMKPNVLAPVFNPGLDVDPRLVVALLDLPGEGDISRLVLRFAGECELIWLNDRNAMTIFSDPSRAATALKRVDHATAYHGAFVLPAASSSGQAPRKFTGWGPVASSSPPRAHHDRGSEREEQQQQLTRGVWLKRKPVTLVSNPWKALEQEHGTSESGKSDSRVGFSANSSGGGDVVTVSEAARLDDKVVDDWETGYE